MYKKIDTSYTQNRELSWLRFNQRVLEEAQDESVPLMERMKFVAIFTSNLDEFFMIRVGSLYDMVHTDAKAKDSRSGMTAQEPDPCNPDRKLHLYIKSAIRLMLRLRKNCIRMECVDLIIKNWNPRRRSM